MDATQVKRGNAFRRKGKREAAEEDLSSRGKSGKERLNPNLLPQGFYHQRGGMGKLGSSLKGMKKIGKKEKVRGFEISAHLIG